jgi:hypothetical protein
LNKSQNITEIRVTSSQDIYQIFIRRLEKASGSLARESYLSVAPRRRGIRAIHPEHSDRIAANAKKKKKSRGVAFSLEPLLKMQEPSFLAKTNFCKSTAAML